MYGVHGEFLSEECSFSLVPASCRSARMPLTNRSALMQVEFVDQRGLSACKVIQVGVGSWEQGPDACDRGTHGVPGTHGPVSFCCNCASNCGYAGYYHLAGRCAACQRRRDDEKAGDHYKATGFRDRSCKHCGKCSKDHVKGTWSTKLFCIASRAPGQKSLAIVSNN